MVIITPIILWHIWLNRNPNYFNNCSTKIDIHRVRTHAAEYLHLTNHNLKKSNLKLKIPIKWTTPPEIIYKLNIDDAHLKNSNIEGAGGIIRDSGGNWIDGFSSHIMVSSPIMGKIISFLKGLKLAFTKNRTPIIMKTNCQVILSLLQDNVHNKANVNFLHDCRFPLDALGHPHVRHIYREGNQVTHTLAIWEQLQLYY